MEGATFENLKTAQDEFAAFIGSKEEIISIIDVKNSLCTKKKENTPIETIFTVDENKSVHVFLYETETHLHILNCNAKGKKIKHETFKFADLELVLRKSTYGIEFTLLAKNGWYYKGNIHKNSSEQLRMLAEKRNIPVKEKNESDTWAFMKMNPYAARPIFLFYALSLIFVLAFFLGWLFD